MVQPINYTALQTNPNEALMQGIKTGLTLETIGQERQQQQLAQQAAQQQQQASLLMQRVLSNPNATASDYGAISAINPKFTESIKQQWDRLDTSRQQQSLGDASKLFSALQAGRPDVALESVETQLKAAENSGDTMKAQQIKAVRDMIQQAPDYARTIIGSTIAATPGGDKYFTTLKTMGEEGRAQAEAPTELAIKRVDLLKRGEDVGLTKAQTLKTIKETEKLGADIQKAAMELQGGGQIDPEKRFDFETKLRKEYSDQTKGFQEVKESYERVKSAQDSGPGDIALIYGYMKMLDPGSVVREGEFATAENSSGIPERMRNVYNKAINGERLTPGQRTNFTGQAKALLNAAEKREKVVRSGVDAVVKSYKLNPDNVFYTPTEETGAPPAARPGAPAPVNYKAKGWAKY